MILPAYQSPSFVMASIFIAILTAYVSIDTSSRIRSYEGDERLMWLIISAICLGGGIWSMHFIAMLGYILPIPIGYNIALTVLSLIIPIVVAGVGFHFASIGPQLSWLKTLVIGSIYGIAIIAMHYTGMAAMRMDAIIDWNIAYVMASIAVAIVASTAAIRAAFLRMSFFPTIVGSILMGFAISGMHYTAMCAVTVIESDMTNTGNVFFTLTRTGLGSGVAGVAFIILMLGALAAAYDRRRSGR